MQSALVEITVSCVASTKIGCESGKVILLPTIVPLTVDAKSVMRVCVRRYTSSCTQPIPWAAVAGFPGPLLYQKDRSVPQDSNQDGPNAQARVRTDGVLVPLPFLLGEEVTEGRITQSDCLETFSLQPLASVRTRSGPHTHTPPASHTAMSD